MRIADACDIDKLAPSRVGMVTNRSQIARTAPLELPERLDTIDLRQRQTFVRAG